MKFSLNNTVWIFRHNIEYACGLYFERTKVMIKTSFGIIGGDKRQLYLAKSIEEDGYKVYICGFELSGETCNLQELSLKTLIERCDNIILPLPCTRDGVNIYAPYSPTDIFLSDELLKLLEGKKVFGGYINKLKYISFKNIDVGDYYLREELAVKNAIPTAEGAIALAVEEHPGIINGSLCLVTGYGRIGKILTKILLALGANVHVAARKSKDFAMVKAMGGKAIRYSEIKDEYDIIFNTVPEIVINSTILSKQNYDTLIIELASLPGGIDRKSAALCGVQIVDAQSLPGKVSPKSSGEFIKETIYNMMEEGKI